MENSQELRQTQKQVLSPKQLYSLELLTLPVLDLDAKLKIELDSNPALELPEEQPDQSTPGATPDGNIFDSSFPTVNYQQPDSESNENLSIAQESLAEHLTHQISNSDAPNEIKKIAFILAHSLDSNGFLSDPLEENQLLAKCDPQQIALAIELLQSLEPTGVGCKNVHEALLLQVMRKNLPDYYTSAIKSHLDLIAKNSQIDLAKKLSISTSTAEHVISEIKKLHPYPASNFNPPAALSVPPDIIIEPHDSDFQAFVNSGKYYRLKTSKLYDEILKTKELSQAEKKTLKQQKTDAQKIINALHNRQSTIKKFANLFMTQQNEFLRNGTKFIAPMKMATVAQQLGVNTSTVSRLVADKYIKSPIGLHPLKLFFSHTYTDQHNQKVSVPAIKIKISEAVRKNNKITDKAIAEKLQTEGIKISTRTINKYRNQMKILPSFYR